MIRSSALWDIGDTPPDRGRRAGSKWLNGSGAIILCGSMVPNSDPKIRNHDEYTTQKHGIILINIMHEEIT